MNLYFLLRKGGREGSCGPGLVEDQGKEWINFETFKMPLMSKCQLCVFVSAWPVILNNYRGRVQTYITEWPVEGATNFILYIFVAVLRHMTN